MNRLDPNLMIKCQWCNGEKTLDEWDKNTYAQCTSREMRRLYMHLHETKAFRRDSGKFYKCPICGQWLKGSQLIVVSDDEKLKRLGGEPIIVIKRQ